jgi:hypothetical protein
MRPIHADCGVVEGTPVVVRIEIFGDLTASCSVEFF